MSALCKCIGFTCFIHKIFLNRWVGRIKNLTTSCRNIKNQIQWNVINRSNNLLYVFHWFLVQIHNILQWTADSRVPYEKRDNWMMETSYNCTKWCSATMYQKVNSSIVSESAMNSFNEMFPLARMFPLAIMHRKLFCLPPFCYTSELKDKALNDEL